MTKAEQHRRQILVYLGDFSRTLTGTSLCQLAGIRVLFVQDWLPVCKKLSADRRLTSESIKYAGG